MGHRKAGRVIGGRERHRHLTVGVLAELTAILVMHPDRILALLGEDAVSSMIHASIEPAFSSAGSIISRILASTSSSSDHVRMTTKWSGE
ncbi:hypothetical protein J2R96_002060 [Bradyrhizobium elkanii]|nr:hypothetical protein [Bradyrhizobium elkanii]